MKKVSSMVMVGVLSFGLLGGVAQIERPALGSKSGKVVLVPEKPSRGIQVPVDPTKRYK